MRTAAGIQQQTAFAFGLAPSAAGGGVVPGKEPQKATDRLFFALFPPADVAARITDVARRHRREFGMQGQPQALDRLHATLVHLGDFVGVPQDVVAGALGVAAALTAASFDVVFDRTLSFGRGAGKRPCVLGGGTGVAALREFRQTLCAALRDAGVAWRETASFTPHVTLLYDEIAVPEQPIEPIGWTVREFVLVHSLIGKAKHVALGRWSLHAAAGVESAPP